MSSKLKKARELVIRVSKGRTLFYSLLNFHSLEECLPIRGAQHIFVKYVLGINLTLWDIRIQNKALST